MPTPGGRACNPETGLKSASTLTVRRYPRLLTRAQGQTTTPMAHALRGTAQTVRHALPACPQRGLPGLQPPASRPSPATLFDAGACAFLQALRPPYKGFEGKFCIRC